ncbi:MAG: hypothetical protein V1798_03670 [Pseudomonadota bacterium]
MTIRRKTPAFGLSFLALFISLVLVASCTKSSVSTDANSAAGKGTSGLVNTGLNRPEDSDVGQILPVPIDPIDKTRVLAQIPDLSTGMAFVVGFPGAVTNRRVTTVYITNLRTDPDRKSFQQVTPALDGSFPQVQLPNSLPGDEVALWVDTSEQVYRIPVLVLQTVFPTRITGMARVGKWLACATSRFKDGTPDIGIYDIRIYYVDADEFLEGNVTPTSHHLTSLDGVPQFSPKALLALENGDLWIGTDQGLIRLRWAPPGPPEFSHFTKANGLPFDYVTALASDPREPRSLYVGTNSGLGFAADASGATIRFQTLHADLDWTTGFPSEENGLFDDLILSLSPAAEGGVWAGTGQGPESVHKRAGITRFVGMKAQETISTASSEDTPDWADGPAFCRRDAQEQKNCTPTTPFVTSGFPGTSVKQIVRDGEGGLWVLTDACLTHIDKTRQSTCFPYLRPTSSSSDSPAYAAGSLGSIAVGTDGTVWATNGAGTILKVEFFANPSVPEITLPLSDTFFSKTLSPVSFLPERSGRMWVASGMLGLAPHDTRNGFTSLGYALGFSSAEPERGGLLDDTSTNLLWNGRRLWMHSELFPDFISSLRLTSSGGGFEGENAQIKHRLIVGSAVAPNHGMWLSTALLSPGRRDPYLERVDDDQCKPAFSEYNPTKSCSLSLPQGFDPGNSLASNSRGDVWYVTGLFSTPALVHVRPDPRNPTDLQSYVIVPHSLPLVPYWGWHGSLLDLYSPDAAGVRTGDILWVATRGKEVFKIGASSPDDKKNLDILAFFSADDLGVKREDMGLKGIKSDGFGGAWVLANPSTVIHIRKDATGGGGGILKLDLGDGVGRINDSTVAPEGDVYLATNAGLARVIADEEGAPRLARWVTTADGLPSNEILAAALEVPEAVPGQAAPGRAERIWLTTDRGIVALPRP